MSSLCIPSGKLGSVCISHFSRLLHNTFNTGKAQIVVSKSFWKKWYWGMFLVDQFNRATLFWNDFPSTKSTTYDKQHVSVQLIIIYFVFSLSLYFGSYDWYFWPVWFLESLCVYKIGAIASGVNIIWINLTFLRNWFGLCHSHLMKILTYIETGFVWIT